MAELGRQLRYARKDDQVKRMWFIHTVGFFFLVTETKQNKKNEVRWLEGKWIKQEIITLSELCQSQKDKYCKCPLWVLDFRENIKSCMH